MQITYRAGGPRKPGNYPVVDVTYEMGVGGPHAVEYKQLLLRVENGLMFMFPTNPDVPDREWAINIDRFIKLQYVATCTFEESDFHDAN